MESVRATLFVTSVRSRKLERIQEKTRRNTTNKEPNEIKRSSRKDMFFPSLCEKLTLKDVEKPSMSSLEFLHDLFHNML
jgi:hypothetical protein